jgi:hypothetical protein
VQPLLQWKSILYYTTWVFLFVALGIQHVTRMRHIFTVACPAVQYFSTLSQERHDFRKTVTENKMCVLTFSTTFIWNISYSKKTWAQYNKKVCIGLHIKYPLFLSGFSEIWICSTGFRKNAQISNFMKIRTVEAELHHEDGRSDGRTDRHDESNSRFSQFCKRT